MGDGEAFDVWGVWRRLVRLLPVWRMPYEWFFSPSVWTIVGLDYVSGLKKNRSTRQIYEVLAPLRPAELRRIHALAHLNNRRHEVVSRWAAIGFVTLPASAALTLSQLAPDILETIASWRGLTAWYRVIAYAGGIVGFYVLSAWRARQLLTIVEMAFIERGVPLHATDEEAQDEALAEPLGA